MEKEQINQLSAQWDQRLHDIHNPLSSKEMLELHHYVHEAAVLLNAEVSVSETKQSAEEYLDSKVEDLHPDIAFVKSYDALKAIEMARKEVKTVYENYISLLQDELNETVGIASVHGWRSKRYDEGVKLREAISEFNQ